MSGPDEDPVDLGFQATVGTLLEQVWSGHLTAQAEE
jgi:hypothetical protein